MGKMSALVGVAKALYDQFSSMGVRTPLTDTPSWTSGSMSPSRPTYQNWSVGKAEWVWSTKYCYERVEIRPETNMRHVL